MAFSLKHLSKSSRTILQTVGLFFSVLIGVFFIMFFTPAVEVTQRIQSGFYSATRIIADWADDTFFARKTLRTEHAYYQSVAAQYTQDAAQVQDLQERVNELEQALGYQQTVDYQGMLARVLSRSLNEQREILIDKGIHDGVVVGEAAIVGDGHLIGVVTDLSNYTATVRLLSDKQSSVAAAILGSDKTVGLIEGRGGYLLSMQYIPQDVRIGVGDVVVTSGLDELIPSGLVIGTVSELITDDAAAFQEARVEQIYQENDFSYVTLLRVPL